MTYVREVGASGSICFLAWWIRNCIVEDNRLRESIDSGMAEQCTGPHYEAASLAGAWMWFMY